MKGLFSALESQLELETDMVSEKELNTDLMEVKSDVLFSDKTAFTLNSLQTELGELDAINNTLTNSSEKYIPESMIRLIHKNLSRIQDKFEIDLQCHIDVFAVENFSPTTISYDKSKSIGLESLNLSRHLTVANVMKIIETVIRWLKKAWQTATVYLNKYSRFLDGAASKWGSILNLEVVSKKFFDETVGGTFIPHDGVIDHIAVTETINGETGLLNMIENHFEIVKDGYIRALKGITSQGAGFNDIELALSEDPELEQSVNIMNEYFRDMYIGPKQRKIVSGLNTGGLALRLSYGIEQGSDLADKTPCMSLRKKDMLDFITRMKTYYKRTISLGFKLDAIIKELDGEFNKTARYVEQKTIKSALDFDTLRNFPDTLLYLQFLSSLVIGNANLLAKAFEVYNAKSIQEYILEEK